MDEPAGHMIRPAVHWIETSRAGRLAIMPRPRAGDWLDDEIAGWRSEGIDIVVSLLEADEVAELGLEREPATCQHNGIEFISYPIPDRGVPASIAETVDLAQSVALGVAQGKATAVHCRAGIGRSALVAACILVCSGFDAVTAFEAIGKARGTGVPDTDGQRAWVEAFHKFLSSGDRLFG
jgi:protein-tyrosine phosphatase